MNKPIRLDIYLTKFEKIQSRNKASELIKNKKIKINNNIITKPSFKVEETMKVEILQDEFFVSRAAYKLKYFLDDITLDIQGLDTLDIGSSTGGFTQILLQKNVKNITCVDVGSNQLHPSLKTNKKLIICENTDIRVFNPNKKYDLVTCDVSFISILNILDDINRLSKKYIIILYKPQYEVGTNIKRNKAGVVLDKNAINFERENFLEQTKILNWNLQYSSLSKLSGKEGNIEELFYFENNQ